MKRKIKLELKPNLRFPEFLDEPEWEDKSICEAADIIAGQSPKGSNYNDTGDGVPFYQGKTEFGDIYINPPAKWTTQVTKLAGKGDILMSVRAPVGALNISTDTICIGRGLASIRPKQSKWFLYYCLLRNQRLIIGNGGSVFDSISKDQIEKIELLFPPTFDEQQRIADCLTSLDELIAAHGRKLDALKAHKKGLMQRLFPRQGETQPRLRFPEFQDAGDWEAKPLSAALDYEQPGPFIVSSENYGASGTPVLTAGKTFILGYTDETNGLFDRLPVIIFDDFTAASQFVDFPFKVKSSAMKILSAREGYSLKFTFEGMSLIGFDASQHKRYWIAEFQHLKMPFPKETEQQRIADCFSSLDAMIAAQAERVDALKTHKKGLMQQLFPSSEEVEA